MFAGSFDTLLRKQASDPRGDSEEYSESAAFLRPVYDPLFTKRCTVKATSASGLFYTVSEKRETPSSYKLLPEENLLDSFCIPKLSPNTDMKNGRPKSIFHDGQVMHGNFIHESPPESITENNFQNASCPWDFSNHTQFHNASKEVGHNSRGTSTRGRDMPQARGSDVPQVTGSVKKPPIPSDTESAIEGECKSSSIDHEESKFGTQESKDCQMLRDHQPEESMLAGNLLDRCIHDKM